MGLLGSLAVPVQISEEGLTKDRQGTPFEIVMPDAIAERPYQGQNYRLSAINLKLIYRLRLTTSQEEEAPALTNCHLTLYRGAEPVASFELDFQMRKVPGTEAKEWVGEAAIFQDLINQIDYSVGQTLTFRISGIVPGRLT